MKFFTKINRLIDRKLIGYLMIFYTVFNILYVLRMIYLRKYLIPRSEHAMSIGEFIMKSILFDWVIVILFMTLIAVNTKKLLEKSESLWGGQKKPASLMRSGLPMG